MIGKRRNNRENTDLLEGVLGLAIDVSLIDEVEERIVVVIDIVYADLKDALSVVFGVRLDELHPDVQMVERFHAEVVLLAVILHISVVDWDTFRKWNVKIFFEGFFCID